MVKKFIKELSFWNKMAILFSILAGIFCVLSIIYKSENLMTATYVYVVISLIANIQSINIQRKNYVNLYLLKYRENLDLRWSYEAMGRYIKQLNEEKIKSPELDDIEFRIQNELRDISIKTEHYAKQIGVSDKDFKKFKEEGRI